MEREPARRERERAMAPREERTPSASSSALIWRDSADCVTNSSSARA
jgi:hypothetical protein